MTAQEIRNDVFEALSSLYNPEGGETRAFVGLQGDDAVVLVQPTGEHFGIRVLPATVGVAG